MNTFVYFLIFLELTATEVDNKRINYDLVLTVVSLPLNHSMPTHRGIYI